MSRAIPIDVYDLLEDKLGKEDARKVASAIEVSLDTIEKKADDVALQKKLELKDELTKELVTKADLLVLRAEMKADILVSETKIESKLRLYFLILLFTMILLNPPAIDLIAKLLGIIK